MTAPRVAVVGSINLDIVATGQTLPRPGETVTDAVLSEFSGGKGANQALAAQRLGGRVTMYGCVGQDSNADKALALLKTNGVNLDAVSQSADQATGVALICVDAGGENQISVAPGANTQVLPGAVDLAPSDAIVAQLEVPVKTLEALSQESGPIKCFNLAPAKPLPKHVIIGADILIVNETEAAFYGDALSASGAIIIKTLGANGAEAHMDGALLAKVPAPKVKPVDTTGCGDTFVGAFVVAYLERKDLEYALQYGCAAGALAATKAGAQAGMPSRSEVDALYKIEYQD